MYRIIFLVTLLIASVNAQNPEWIVYDTSNSGLPENTVWEIEIDSAGIKWIGTLGGVASFDGTNWMTYDTSNSGLPENTVLAIEIDSAGIKWIGTYGGGLASYDGTTWEVYTTDNSGLPDNNISAIAIESDGTKWIGTDGGLASYDGTSWVVHNSFLPSIGVSAIAIESDGTKWIGTYGGLASYDGSRWVNYTPDNSGLPGFDNPYVYITDITIDESGTKWIGIFPVGLVSFDGTNWEVYTQDNSGLPDNGVFAIANDNSGKMWIGTDGLASYDGTNWVVYNIYNSDLPSNDIGTIETDASGNVWIGTIRWPEAPSGRGMAVYQAGGVVGIDDEVQSGILIDNFRLHQNYPNPFNPSTTISYELPEQSTMSLTVYDVQGQEIVTLQNGGKPPGNYDVQWNGLNQSGNQTSTGVYFCRLRAGSFSKTIKMVYLR